MNLDEAVEAMRSASAVLERAILRVDAADVEKRTADTEALNARIAFGGCRDQLLRAAVDG